MTQYTNEQLIEWLDDVIKHPNGTNLIHHGRAIAIRTRLTQSPPASPVAVQDGDEKIVRELIYLTTIGLSVPLKGCRDAEQAFNRLTSRAQVDSQAVRDTREVTQENFKEFI